MMMAEAWRVYDALLQDDRIALYPEPADVELEFRGMSASRTASPKICADAYLIAFASCHQAQIVTFDQALKSRGVNCLVLR
jgi:predicted nucleic acid-binding protein